GADNLPTHTFDLGLKDEEGSMSVWFKTTESGTIRHILSNNEVASGLFTLYLDRNDKLSLYTRASDGTMNTVLTSNHNVPINEWMFASFKWNENIDGTLTLTMFLNDEKLTTTLNDWKDFTGTITKLGTNVNGDDSLNGYMEQFTYSTVALSDTDIQSIYNQGRLNHVHYAYDDLGRLDTRSLYTGNTMFETTFTYGQGGYGTGSTTGQIDTINNNGDVITYDYDENGNIRTITQNGQTITYVYDELNQLIRENNGVLDQTIIYEYDNGGNLQSKKEYAYTESTADLTGSDRQTNIYLYENTNWLDQLTSYNGQTIEYDNLGNPISYNGYTYNWTFGDRLAGISGNGLETSYRYNDGGYRTQKEVNGVITTYTLEGSLVTHETNGVDEIYYTYDANGDLVSMNLNGEEYYYIKNIQGDMIGLYDQYGTKVVSYQYDTWGNIVSISGDLADTIGEKNPYRYRGYRYDSETGLYYLNARYYNPEWGRFLNADSYGGSTGKLLSHNVYAYVMI
ncbi:RHS repeat-associated core domain-containing protein, partial [Bacillaceae bacterium W0354]